MKITTLSIPDVKFIEPKVFNDERGFFFESFNHSIFEKKIGFSIFFVQDNYSKSKKRVLRGLHYQLPPKAQGKLVSVVQGEIFDVVVDIRRNSSTFGYWIGETLTNTNKKQLWIPEGFAHGFLVLSESAEILYKTTNYYSPKHERFINWNDTDLNIDWKLGGLDPIISKQDKQGVAFKDADYF